jgi:serine/threonine-protein kinase
MKPWSEGQSNFPPRLTFAILLVLSIPRITTKGVKLATPAETSTDSKVSRNGLKGKDPLSILERSLVSRGFATPEDLNRARLSLSAANSHGSNPGASPSGTAFLSVLVDRGVLTTAQSERLSREIVSDTPKRIEIPGFQMLEKIGRGCMGVVYKARQTSVDRIVAVKILLPSLAKNPSYVQRFVREAKMAAALSHPNLVSVIDAGSAGGLYFFVMEYVEGKSVGERLLEVGRFEEKEALGIAMSVAEALLHANERGLIHRDVKPDNIMIHRDRAKLADLGLARPTADETWALAEAGLAVGTPYYISPEQARGEVHIDIRTDLYSLGATLYHMVTGRPPFQGETSAEVTRQHADINLSAAPPDHLNDKISSGFGVVVETLLAKDRKNRYQQPKDLIHDLKNLIAGQPPDIAQQSVSEFGRLREGDSLDEADQLQELQSEIEAKDLKIQSLTQWNALLAILAGISCAATIFSFLI